jgi:hypothetical protein
MAKRPASAYATFHRCVFYALHSLCTASRRVHILEGSGQIARSCSTRKHTAVARASARKSAEPRLGHNFVCMTSLADPLSPYRVEEHRQSVC